MKSKCLYSFGFLLLIFFQFQGVKSQVDSKYLKVAVPEVNGKVVFSDTIILPGIPQNDIYEKVLKWAESNYNSNESRLIFSDKDKGTIACRGYDTLVFSSGALSLDRTFMNYQLIIYCKDNGCRYDLRSISYDYNTSSDKNAEKLSAEEWITDKEAINKNKLYRNNGKFRIKTIDLVDDIYNSLSITLNTGEIDLYANKEKANRYSRQSTSQQQPPVVAPVNQLQPATTPQATTSKQVFTIAETQEKETTTPSALPGYKRMEAEKIPGNIIKMLNNDWMLITAGTDTQFNMLTTNWGGLGILFGKPVAFCFINPVRHTYQLMETNDTYTLSFYTEAYREALRYCATALGKETDKIKGSGLTPITLPSGCKSFGEAWLIIECKKLLAQPIEAESIQDKKAKEEFGIFPLHKMFVGEILNVWVK